jgi:hypothetical protein
VVPHLDLVVVAARHKQGLGGVEVDAAHRACAVGRGERMRQAATEASGQTSQETNQKTRLGERLELSPSCSSKRSMRVPMR